MASNNLVKARGAMEGLDHMILKRKKEIGYQRYGD